MHIQTYEDALSYIFQEELTNKYDVTQVQKADKALGHPHRAYQNIHIAGTNGKGSTAKMVFSILEKAGKKVGCFTSPHLVDVRERIQTQDGCISKKDFVRLLNKVLATKISLSYFELLTMIAFLYFQEKKCEYAVIEVGLGGLLDATNIITPVITCITNIGLDHQEILGKTIREIAKQKAGIIKERIPLVLGQRNADIEKFARQKKASIIFADRPKKTNLLGKHQNSNAGIAYAIGKKLGISKKYILQGLQNVVHQGRLQYLSPNLCIDGAHNINGFLSLKTYLHTMQKKYKKIIYCFALKKGKNPKNTILPIFGRDKQYIIVKKRGYKLENVISLEKEMKGLTYSMKTPTQIKNLAKKNTKILYMVFGSLYMIGAFLPSGKNC